MLPHGREVWTDAATGAVVLRRRILSTGAAALAVLLVCVAAPGPSAGALPATATPVLELARVMRTTPFSESRQSVLDSEGSGYVARDRSVWIADDDGDRLFEIDARTGRLRRTVDEDSLADVRREGGGPQAGPDSVGDLEAVAYDRKKDYLYVFSGSCCSPTARSAVFRLARQKGKLRPDSYQPLPAGTDFTAAAWNPTERRLYVGIDRLIWSYRFQRNVIGSPVAVAGMSGLLGMVFTRDGKGLFVTRSPSVLSLLDWPTRTFVPGWTFDLAPWGVLDARAVELVRGRLWVSDGYDLRTPGDPLDHGLFVFEVH
jgi:hypothetical protein